MAGDRDEVIETERKYEAGPDFRVPDLAGLPGVAEVTGPREHRLTAVYFDTAGLSLASAGVTLRYRTGGTDDGWHLKLPAGGESRREVHAPPGEDPGTVPARLAERVTGRTGGAALAPAAKLETTRAVRGLLDGRGQLLAEVADDRVTGSVPAGGDGWRQAITWREMEVELAAGPPDLLEAVGGRLRAAGAARSESPSKLIMVLRSAGLLPGPPEGIRES